MVSHSDPTWNMETLTHLLSLDLFLDILLLDTLCTYCRIDYSSLLQVPLSQEDKHLNNLLCPPSPQIG